MNRAPTLFLSDICIPRTSGMNQRLIRSVRFTCSRLCYRSWGSQNVPVEVALPTDITECFFDAVIVDVEDFDGLALMGDDENDLLDGVSHRSTTSRLSCQIIFGEDLAGLRIRIAPED
jgi:hypothetical protein